MEGPTQKTSLLKKLLALVLAFGLVFLLSVIPLVRVV